MPRYVIDAPTLLHLVAIDVQVAPEHQLVAPHLLRSQALSLLYEAVRRGDLAREEALERHERLTAMKTRLLGDRVSRAVAWQIAEECGWDKTYDAEIPRGHAAASRCLRDRGPADGEAGRRRRSAGDSDRPRIAPDVPVSVGGRR